MMVTRKEERPLLSFFLENPNPFFRVDVHNKLFTSEKEEGVCQGFIGVFCTSNKEPMWESPMGIQQRSFS